MRGTQEPDSHASQGHSLGKMNLVALRETQATSEPNVYWELDLALYGKKKASKYWVKDFASAPVSRKHDAPNPWFALPDWAEDVSLVTEKPDRHFVVAANDKIAQVFIGGQAKAQCRVSLMNRLIKEGTQERVELPPKPAIAKKDEIHSHYKRDVSHLDLIDIYRFIDLFNIECPVAQDILKKSAAVGQRGHKDLKRDWADIRDSAQRKLEMLEEDSLKK